MNATTQPPYDCLIIGAGIAGLMAAKELSSNGYRVAVLEKSRGVGGRMATRRWDEARFDHGAQFFTVTDPKFDTYRQGWERDGLIAPWFGQDENRVRFRGEPTLTSVPKALAKELDILRQSKARRATFENGLWTIVNESGESVSAKALLSTAPAPQSLEILADSNIDWPQGDLDFLRSIQYTRCVAALLLLDSPSGLASPGYHKFPSPEPLDVISDNQAKGSSPVPAVTLHSGPEFGAEYFEASDEIRLPILIEAARAIISAQVLASKGHRWGYAHRLTDVSQSHYALPSHRLWLAGDSFGPPKIEGAALSGLAAAEAIKAAID